MKDARTGEKLPKGFISGDPYRASHSGKVLFTIDDQDQLLVFSVLSGTMWVFDLQWGNLSKTMRIWPEKILLEYANDMKDSIKMGTYSKLFSRLLLDGDAPDSVLLEYEYFFSNREANEYYIYQIDLAGQLEKVYFVSPSKKVHLRLLGKKNNKFYFRTRNALENTITAVYKEEK